MALTYVNNVTSGAPKRLPTDQVPRVREPDTYIPPFIEHCLEGAINSWHRTGSARNNRGDQVRMWTLEFNRGFGRAGVAIDPEDIFLLAVYYQPW